MNLCLWFISTDQSGCKLMLCCPKEKEVSSLAVRNSSQPESSESHFLFLSLNWGFRHRGVVKMNHLMSVQHSEYKVLCNSSSKPWERISAFMGEHAPTQKELSTSAQMAFEETQQHSWLSFVPDQQHLSQNSWCPTGKLSINQFSFGQPSWLWSCPKKKQKDFYYFYLKLA